MPRLLVISVLVAGCSYTPVADLRVSDDKAHLYQRDVSECRSLVDQVTMSVQYALRIKYLNECLKGRGHSIIGGV